MMKIYNKFFLLFVLGGVIFFDAHTVIRFGSKTSSLVAGDDGVLNIATSGLTVDAGTVTKKKTGQVKGRSIRFENAYFNSWLSEGFITGTFVPDDADGVIELQNPETDSGDFLLTNPGGLFSKVKVKDEGTGVLRGNPLFFGTDDIIVEAPSESSTSVGWLALGVQNTVNTNINLNGGVLELQGDLSLGDDASIVGGGQVVFNNRRLSLGGTASYWTDSLLWNNALDLQLNSKVTLQGAWLFYSDCQVNGNGNVLDIADGILLLYPGAKLRLSGVRLKGLGSGEIIMAEDSELILSDVEIEMNDDYDIYAGGVYVDGSTNIITKDHTLTFRSSTDDDWGIAFDAEFNLEYIKGLDTHGSLTIDRVALTYDPLEFIDKFNIRPLRIQDPNHKFVNIIHNGSIRKFRMESISFLDYSSDTAMQRYAVVMPARPVKIFPESTGGKLNYDFTVRGRSNYYRFTCAHEPLIFISDDVHVVYEDLLFSEFSAEYLSLGSNASLIFGDKTTVQLFRSEELNYTWTFRGNAILRGGGSILTLGSHGNIVLDGEGSTLLIDGLTLKGVTDNNVRCLKGSSKIIFKDVKWVQSGDFTFDTGAFDLLGDLTMASPYTFSYTTTQKSTILSDSTLTLMRGMTFNYQPAVTTGASAKSLLYLQDFSSTLVLNEVTLSAPAPGIQLTNGRLILSKRNILKNDGAQSKSDGFVWGDGDADHNLTIEQSTSDFYEMSSGGIVDNQNVYA